LDCFEDSQLARRTGFVDPLSLPTVLFLAESKLCKTQVVFGFERPENILLS
jgi:hypothetical protein